MAEKDQDAIEKMTDKKEDRARLRQILSVFRKHHMLGNLVRMKNPESFREGLEELGPTFVKIGQMLSVRSDMLSPEYIAELEKLQGNTRSDEWEVIRPILEKNLGCSMKEVFSSIEEKAFASASIAQVHKAVLKKEQQEVVLKIQHPGIGELMERDFSLIRRLLPIAEKTPFSKNINFREVISELHNSIRQELDFQNEAKNTERFYGNNHEDWGIYSPKVIEEWTTKELLILTEIQGEELSAYLERTESDFQSGDEKEKNRRTRIADRLITNYFKQVFQDSFFHADPHPGNIMIELAAEGETFPAKEKIRHMELGPIEVGFSKGENELLTEKITWLDFGMMGTLDKNLQKKLKQLIVAVFSQNDHKIGEALLNLCPAKGIIDEEAYENRVSELFRKYYTLPMNELQIGDLLEDAVTLSRTFQLKLPESLMMLARGVSTLQGIVEKLNPELSIMEAIAPYVTRFMLEDFSVKNLAKDYGQMAWNMLNQFPKAPDKLYNLLDQVESGRFTIQNEQGKSKNQQKFEERQLRRGIMAFLSGMLLIAGAILVVASTTSAKVSAGICFFFAILLIKLLLWDFFRSSRRK